MTVRAPCAEQATAGVAVTDLAALQTSGRVRVRVGEHRLLILRAGEGIVAVADACPHEGYSLREGELRGGLLTCHFHNWKFRLTDGACVLGDGDLRTYPVTVDRDGQVRVDLGVTASAEHYRLREQLRRSWSRGATGQLSRDVVALLGRGASPHDLISEALADSAAAAEDGWGHAHSAAVDCAAMIRPDMGAAAAYPVVRAIAGLPAPAPSGEVTAAPAACPPARPAAGDRFVRRLVELVEDEAMDEARALTAAGVAGGALDDVQHALLAAAAAHHLGGGHVVVHLARAFQWMEATRPVFAAAVLPALVTTVVRGAREDRLPRLQGFLAAVRELHRRQPGAETTRLAALALFEVHRAARRAGASGEGEVSATPASPAADTFEDGLREQRADDAAAHLARLPVAEAAARLEWACLRDGVASPRSHQHLLETVRAAVGEAEALGSTRPLAAAARFLAGPRLEVPLARQVRWAIAHQR